MMAEITPEREDATRDRNRVTMTKVVKVGRSLQKLRDENTPKDVDRVATALNSVKTADSSHTC